MVDIDGSAIAQAALKYLGTPYVWGGNSLTAGVDCSGLVQQVLAQFGVQVPRTTYNQINSGAAVDMGNLRAGDLVFFDTDRTKAGPDHVGIYLGGGKFIEAPRPGAVVRVSNLATGYYADRFMGGRRLPGVTGGLGDSSQAATQSAAAALAAQPKLDAATLAETYGMSYAFFKSQPALLTLLKQAVGGQWTADVFTAHLKNSDWWKTTSETQRQAQILQTTDPATWNAQVDAARTALQQQAVQMGAVVSSKNLNQAAQNAVALGWQKEQIQAFLGQYIQFNKDHVLGGQAGVDAQQIHATAHANGLRLSDQAVKNYAASIGRGLTSMQDVLGGIRQQAAGAFPAYAEEIMAGANVSDIAAPYAQVMASELQLPDTSVDPFTPQIKQALTRRDDKGLPAPMDLGDFTQLVRGDPRWRRTDGALASAMTVAHGVLQQMGLAT